MNQKPAGIVVLYNPTHEVLKNIESYRTDLSTLFVVDNSDKPHPEIEKSLRELSHTSFVSMQGNKGIAAALNKGMNLAQEKGAEWVLTMDQDSVAQPSMMGIMTNYIEDHPAKDVGIVSPFHVIHNQLPVSDLEFEDVPTTMTSGNLVHMSVFKTVGPFDEKLFIDYVDHEFCLRLRSHNFRIVQLNTAHLTHHLGNYTQSEIAGHTVGYTNHNFVRRYYITRNRLYVSSLYKKAFPDFYQREMHEFNHELYKIILFERNKYKKITSIVRGYLDFKRNVFGKIKD